MTASVYAPLRERTPGILLAPFAWATEPLFAMSRADPGLASELLQIDRSRLHLIGLVLAHMDDDASSPGFVSYVIGAPMRDVLDRVLGYRPLGLRRALAHLPPAVMQPETYLRLVHLLDDRATAKLLFHAETITESTVEMLDATSPALRRFVLERLGAHPVPTGLSPGLHLLASRGATNFDTLVTELAAAADAQQFVATLNGFVDCLPLPTPPPERIVRARRLDRLTEVRALAKRWRNCLAGFTDAINSGEGAVYLWEDPNSPAACHVRRHGRLGFFLEDMKGPQNAEIEPERLEHIRDAFGDAGIPPASAIECLQNLLLFGGLGGLRRGW